MKVEDMNFPVFRKYRNDRSYFKIINPMLLEEIQIVGKQRVIHRLVANLYPDKLFIRDLLLNERLTDEISEEEYERAKVL